MNNEIQHQNIPMTPVKSSQIAAIGHDSKTNTLSIQFASKSGAGSVYHYANFDSAAFDAFSSAESIGAHFGKEIKPHAELHPYVKVS